MFVSIIGDLLDSRLDAPGTRANLIVGLRRRRQDSVSEPLNN
jgi:hypothetical protein